MGRALFDLMFGNPRRLRGTAIVLAIALMIFGRPAWECLVNRGVDGINWTLTTVITGMWQWIQIAGLVLVAFYGIRSVFRGGRGG